MNNNTQLNGKLRFKNIKNLITKLVRVEMN